MSVLVVASHGDDEVLGAGATIARLAEREDVHLLVLTDGVRGRFPGAYTSLLETKERPYHEACQQRERECREAARVLGIASVDFERFFDQQLDVIPLGRIVNAIMRNARGKRLILTHGTRDMNQDHRRACEATLIAARPWGDVPVPEVWGYLVDPPGSIGLSTPAHYIEVDGSSDCHMAKLWAAFACYKSEQREFPHPTSQEAMTARRKVHGIAAGVKFAEAFEMLQSIDHLPTESA